MNANFLAIALCFFCCTTQSLVAQNNNTDVDVTVFESVLSTAGWANFKYVDQLSQAKQGDYKATLKLLEFSGTVDGIAALDHSVTLLELLLSGGDLPFAAAVNMAKPKLKSVLLDRLQLAQARTQKVELRKPIAEWAPTTWAVLHGEPFAPINYSNMDSSCLNSNPHSGKEKEAKALELSSNPTTPSTKEAAKEEQGKGNQ
jgi:hypothetical protein